MSNVLVVGDAHVDETQNGAGLDRFTALGNKIAAEQPDYIIIIGDFVSLNCLSDWDRNKRKTMEGKRYQLEIAAGNEALDRMMAGIARAYEATKRAKKKPYIPTVVYIEGNHENRLTRFLAVDPTFEGTVNLEQDLQLEERGIVFIPYKDIYNIDGVSFTHVPIGGTGKPIGNPGVSAKALRLFAGSVVFGHTHTLDHCAEHRHGYPHLCQALSVGCFFEHVDEYAKGARTDYWRGLVDLDIYGTNRFDIATTSMSQLKRKYL